MACSSLFHCALGAIAVAVWLLGLGVFDSITTATPTLTVMPPRDRAEAIALTSTIVPAAETDVATILDGEELLAAMSDPRWQNLVDPVAAEEAPSSGILVTQEITRITHVAKARSVEENLSRLNDLTQQISSEGAVDDISKQLSKVLQTEERADRPAEEPIAGEFEFTTAQLHDVLQKMDEQGNVTYWAVLVDAAGRKFESPMGQSEGETAFRTMNLIKTNPLLERVYRGVVMSMMDQVLKNAR